MAIFLDALAESGIVQQAADAARKSTTAAYALRRRNPPFAQAWESALGAARDKLADTLLDRALQGNVEHIFKDGEIVAEKHVLDNRLGLAILKRLDQRTDGTAGHRREPRAMPAKTPDWDLALTALRTGEEGDLAAALALFRSDEVGEVGEVVDPPLPYGPCQFCADADEQPATEKDHCWKEEGIWWTDFPPPVDFAGVEKGRWGAFLYRRHCTTDEIVLLEAEDLLDTHQRRSEASAKRDRWFAELKQLVDEDGGAALVDELRDALSTAR